MCGICGVFNYRTGAPVSPDRLVAMRDTMVHRGPDDAGCWHDGSVGLAHRRLSILDLSRQGRQPMVSFDKTHVISFNGEVYNYRELKEQYCQNYPFTSQTDTEVILAMYRQYGAACVEYFNGMFAFAVYNTETKELFCARDRIGIKPFYYALTEDGILFASEIKALVHHATVPRTIRRNKIVDYMHFGYVPGDETMFSSVKRLPPAHVMTIRDGTVSVRRYWELEYTQEKDRGERVHMEEFRHLFDSAIDLRLRADVPVGVFLSGGLDSSSVVAQLGIRENKGLKTFSVAYDFGREFNETPYARLVAQRYGTDHHECMVTPRMFCDFVPEYVHYMDEPVTEAAAISLYYLAKLTKEKVTVVLSGEGADELLGGYDIYRYMQGLARYRSIPASVRNGVIEPLLRCAGSAKINKYLDLARQPIRGSYRGVSLYEKGGVAAMLTPAFTQSVSSYDFDGETARFFPRSPAHPLNTMLSFDMKTWLVDNLLIKADKMSMAPALELRVPFLDHRMVEYCARLPVKYKAGWFTKKYLLKKCMADLVPPEIIKRKKVGFPTPLKIMFKGELYSYVADTLTGTTCRERGVFSPQTIATMLADHRSGARDFHRELWQMVVFEEWCTRFRVGMES